MCSSRSPSRSHRPELVDLTAATARTQLGGRCGGPPVAFRPRPRSVAPCRYSDPHPQVQGSIRSRPSVARTLSTSRPQLVHRKIPGIPGVFPADPSPTDPEGGLSVMSFEDADLRSMAAPRRVRVSHPHNLQVRGIPARRHAAVPRRHLHRGRRNSIPRTSTSPPTDISTEGDHLAQRRRVNPPTPSPWQRATVVPVLLDVVGGPAALVTLQAATRAISNAARDATIIEEHALLRRLIGVAGEIAEMSVQPSRRCHQDRRHRRVAHVRGGPAPRHRLHGPDR